MLRYVLKDGLYLIQHMSIAAENNLFNKINKQTKKIMTNFDQIYGA